MHLKNELSIIAFHEAGHAVTAYALRQPFKSITIEGGGSFDGCIVYIKGHEQLNKKRIFLYTIACLSGFKAGKMFIEKYEKAGIKKKIKKHFEGSWDDFNSVLDIDSLNPEFDTVIRSEKTEKLLSLLWPQIETVASILLKKTTLQFSEINDILDPYFTELLSEKVCEIVGCFV